MLEDSIKSIKELRDEGSRTCCSNIGACEHLTILEDYANSQSRTCSFHDLRLDYCALFKKRTQMKTTFNGLQPRLISPNLHCDLVRLVEGYTGYTIHT